MHKKCMVIDLDETLVHSSFKVSISDEIRASDDKCVGGRERYCYDLFANKDHNEALFQVDYQSVDFRSWKYKSKYYRI